MNVQSRNRESYRPRQMRMRFRGNVRRYVLPESPPDPRHVRTLPRGLQAAAQWKRLVKTFTMRFRGNVADAMGRIMTIGSAPCPRHESASLGACQRGVMGVSCITVQPVDEGNSDSAARFPNRVGQ